MADKETKEITRGDVRAWRGYYKLCPDEQTLLGIVEQLIDERDNARVDRFLLKKDLDMLRKAYAELKAKN